jgi:hypothetical protein
MYIRKYEKSNTMKNYTAIQIKKETHALLQEYCREHGYKLSGLVDSLIKQRINKPKPTNTLPVKTLHN